MPNKTTEGFDAAAYMREYITEKVIYKRVNFTKGKAEDQELLDWVAAQPEGISPYLKRLIRQDMEARTSEEEKHDDEA